MGTCFLLPNQLKPFPNLCQFKGLSNTHTIFQHPETICIYRTLIKVLHGKHVNRQTYNQNCNKDQFQLLLLCQKNILIAFIFPWLFFLFYSDIKYLFRLVYYIKHNAILAKLFTYIRTGFNLYLKQIILMYTFLIP